MRESFDLKVQGTALNSIKQDLVDKKSSVYFVPDTYIYLSNLLLVDEDMVSTTSKLNPKNVYQIGGLQVEFPYQPYGTQLAFMSRVISTLDRAQRDGHCHALLESPTGTGKSLSLLCSVLAWQHKYRTLFPNGHSNDGPPIPTIFYASRTHAQIAQVIREYRKTGYRVPMAVLGSRKRYCTNPHVQGKKNVDEKCRLLLKDPKNIKCPEYSGVNDILQSLGKNEVHDIEDLVKIGKSVGGCPYYASTRMLEVAQLVFCPYSYLIDPLIRQKVEKLLRGAIIIFDEAHNMEDIAREAGSMDLEEETLFKLQNDLEQMSVEEPEIYQPVFEIIEGLISWIGRKKDSLAKRDDEHYFSGWTGDEALRELKESNIISPESLECFRRAIETSEMKPVMPYLSAISVSTLEEMLTTFNYFFSRNGSHILDYQLGLQRSIKRGDSSGSWTHTFSLWCMNPSVVFKDLVDLSLSIILTSGTLAPMDSFSSELGMQFGTCLEAPHVIDADLQVWAGAISSGPGNYPLNASYKTADEYSFQDTLGKSLEEICTIVPGGSLVFFPSYKLMEKLRTRWRETGQWSRLCLKKELFVEPRGEAKDEFESVLKRYYDSIRGNNKVIGRDKKAMAQDDSKRGSAFLAVCRGKVSEGLDFSDDKARAVIIVGIPFPNLRDILIELKRKYNDSYKSSKNLLGGSDWYCQQAYRALNQAAGRCIRHRFDYGAIIFLDERYRQQRNRASISKWLRQSIKLYDNFEESMQGLRSYFHSVKERVDSKILDSPVEQNLSSEQQPKDIAGRKVVDVESYTSSNAKYPFMKESKGFKDWKPKIAETSRSMLFSGVKYGAGAQTFVQVKEEAKCYKEVIDLECGVKPEPRYCEVSTVTNCDCISAASECSSTKIESCSDQFLKPHKSSANIRRSPLGTESSGVVTLAAESPSNRSVNSHALKRRKFTGSPVIIDLEEENTTRPVDHTSFTRRIEFGFGSNERNYYISCLVCTSPLGHPDSYLNCSLTSLSKTYLLSLVKEASAEMPTSVSVIMTDSSFVNQRLCTSLEGSKGIWCEEDGCVFNTIFCPFCSTCLGVLVMATDSSNVQFLRKILFFADQVEATEVAASTRVMCLNQQRDLPTPQKQEQDSVQGTNSKSRPPKHILPTSNNP